MQVEFSLRGVMIAASCLVLAACGGGGGSDEGNGPGNAPPSVDAGAPQTVNEFETVTLDGSASDRDGDALTYSWEQSAGTAVAIDNANSPAASFAAPDVRAVDAPVVLTFRLTVNDGTASNFDTVDITVEDIGLGANSPPAADAGGDQGVVELTTVSLDGSTSSDPDGDVLTYSWVQTGGPIVLLNNGESAQPSFTAPDVAPGATVDLTFELTVSDGSDSASDTVVISVSETLSLVTVAGRLSYERPQENLQCLGFDFTTPFILPVRLASVLLLDSANTVIATGRTDMDGNYSFANIPANTDVRIRIRSESVQDSGPHRWEVYVRDNTSEIALPLAERPLYEVQGALFNVGSTNQTDRDLTVRTGWSGGSYTGERAAAPLAILDSFIDGIELVRGVDGNVDFGRLDAFWSINNTYPDGDDVDDGQLVTAFYTSDPEFDGVRNPSLFLRGDAIGRFPASRINTDEFDEYVILHEWGHFFEDQLSRSDSRGGYHQIPGKVDALVAFGEGWGHAIGAIAPNDPVGCDTGHPASSGSEFDMERWNLYTDEQGFYNEMSVATFLWDLFDTDIDGTDNGSIGFGPIYDTMINAQRDTPAMTTLFSFATELRQNVDPVDIAFVDSQLQHENIDTIGLDIWASGQTTAPTSWHDGSQVKDLLPLFTELVPGGPTENLCVNVETRVDDTHNNPGKWRYLYFTLDSQQDLTLTIQANPVPPNLNPGPDQRDRSDPDVYLFRNGVYLGDFVGGLSPESDREIYNMGSLAAGTYALEFHDWRHIDFETETDPPAQHPNYAERVCFDFTLN